MSRRWGSITTVVLGAAAILHCGQTDPYPRLINDLPVEAGTTDALVESVDATTHPPPSTTDAATDASPIVITGPEGGGTAQTVKVVGDDGGVLTSVTFGANGRIACGSAPSSLPITISASGGTSPVHWTAKLGTGATNYVVSPTSGTIAPPATGAIVQVIPQPIPASSPVTADLYGGVLSISTDQPSDPIHVVQLHETAQGVILQSTLSGTVDFGGVAVGHTASSQFSVTNNGNVGVDVTIATGSVAFTVSTPTFHLGPNETKAPNINFTPGDAQTYVDTLIMTVAQSTVLCGALPTNVTLQGKGTKAVAVAPTNLDFGSINCGTAATDIPAQTLTLQNTGPALNFTTALTKGSNSPFYGRITPSSGAIASGGSATITVQPNDIPYPQATDPNALGDTLSIQTDSPGDAPHNVTLNLTARGAILAFDPSTIVTHDPVSNHVTFAPFSVVNHGNDKASYTLSIVTDTGGAASHWTTNLTGGTLVGGAGQSGTISVTSSTTQILGHVHMTVTSGDDGGALVLCADPPPDLELSVEPPPP